MAKSLIEMLSEKGVKVFSSTPLWVSVGEKISTVRVGADCVVIESEKFPGSYQLVLQEEDKRVYIPLKQGVSPSLEEYSLQQFTATREWPERNIAAGETRIFAI